jgi:hypothetical protein
MEPGNYQKKPVVVQAMILDGTPAEMMEVYHWIEANTKGSFDPFSVPPGDGVSIDPATGELMISTLEGIMRAKKGDWIIRGAKGEFYPCKPDVFEQVYELASEPYVLPE